MTDRATTYDELKDAITRAYPDAVARSCSASPASRSRSRTTWRSARWRRWPRRPRCSPRRMIRFANALGFGGFSEMQQVFRGHLVERSRQLPRAHRADAPQQPAARDRRRAAPVRRRGGRRAAASSRSTSTPKALAAAAKLLAARAADPRAGAAARLPGRRLPRLRAQPARAARASARRRWAACCDELRAQHRQGRRAAGGELSQLLARGDRGRAACQRARRAGDRDHRQRRCRR